MATETRMDSPFTLGIPTRNRAALLQELLDNLCANKFTVPVIISDDSAQDDTEKLVTSYHDKLPINYFRLRDAPEMQHRCNANNILRLVPSRYLVMMCDDDLFHTESLSRYCELVAWMETQPAPPAAVWTDREVFTSAQEAKDLLARGSSSKHKAPSVRMFGINEYVRWFSRHGTGGNYPGMLLDMEQLRRVDCQIFTDGGNRYDKLLFLYLNTLFPVGHYRRKTVLYRLHSGQDSNDHIYDNQLLFLKKIAEIIADKKLVRAIKRQRLQSVSRELGTMTLPQKFAFARDAGLGNWDRIRSVTRAVFRSVTRVV